jgi:Fic family protein
MAYQSLEKLFHMDASSARFARNEQLAQERFNAQTTFKTGFASSTGELFVANPPELLCLQEEVLVRERAVELLLAKLPRVAQGATVRSLIVDEVVCTNELEGVYSTRRQINELLEQDLHQEKQDKRDESAGQKRFRELARLYLGLSLQPQERLQPACPEDIRKIYDLAMRGEDLGSDAPDGTLFRKGRVEVIGAGQKVLHEGLYPESAITQAVQRMLDIVNSNEIPALCGALVGHYLFEYAHPFYDGNGRTGRYLLSLALTRSLSMLTTLSLSRAIAQNRSPYYRAFKEAQSSLNHGELTMFVMTMLGYIREAQEELVTDLQYKKALLEVVESNITNENDSGIASLTSKQSAILSRLAQQRLFGAFPDVALIEIADYIGIGTQMARKHVAALEAEGLVETTFKRPLRFALSTEGTRRLGIANA